MPLANVTFLDNGTTVEKKSKTFAQNIHTLLKDGFFMDNTMGSFAIEKIEGVYKFLSTIAEEYQGEMTQEEALFIIDNIGEPLFRNKLNKLYYNKFPKDMNVKMQSYINEIEKLNKTIENATSLDKSELKYLEKKLREALVTIKNLGGVKDDKD